MATKKLQDLEASTNPSDTDILMIEDASATKKIKFLDMVNKIKDKLGINKINESLSTLNSDLSTISADLDNGKQDVISHRLITTSDKPFANFSFLLDGAGYFPCVLTVGGEVYIISFNAVTTYITKNPISQYHSEALKNLWCIQDNDGGTRIKIQTQSATEVNILTLRTNFSLFNSYIASS